MDGDEGVFALAFGGFGFELGGFGIGFIIGFVLVDGGALGLFSLFVFVEAVPEDVGELVGVVLVGT